MRSFLLRRLHGSRFWSDYRPGPPRTSVALAVLGGALVVLGVAVDTAPLGPLLTVGGALLLLPLAAAMVLAGWVRRRRSSLRAEILDAVEWRDGAAILDVACGSGMLLVGAARRLARGRVVGIDQWNPGDGGGDRELLLRNARAEGVADRIEVVEGDARAMPFEDGAFDVVLCSGAVHHIVRERADFDRLIGELGRVLRPGGQLILWDVPHVIDVATGRLAALGIGAESRPTGPFFGFRNTLLVGRKAERQAAAS